LVLFFLSVWLIGWIYGGATLVLRDLFALHTPLNLFFPIIWVDGLAFAGFNWCWKLSGYEILKVYDDRVIVEYRLFGRSTERSCETRGIENLRILPPDPREGIEMRGHFWVNTGRIGFDCDGNVFKFGESLNRVERERLFSILETYIR
jgi:hypothetical protein